MYQVNGKEIAAILTKALDVIAMGDTSSNQNVRLDFSKSGIVINAQTSAGTYTSTLNVASKTKPEVKTGIVSASILLSYVKSREQVSLIPVADSLSVLAKGVKGQLFYVGSEYDVEVDKPDDGIRLTSLANFVTEAISRTSDMKDRVEQKSNMLANIVCGKDGHFFSVGDSHHVVLVHSPSAAKKSVNITMATNNMKRIFGIGGTLSILPSRIVAHTETEYLSLNATVEGEAVSVSNILELKKGVTKKAGFEFDAGQLLETLTSMLTGTESDTLVNVTLDGSKISMSVSTGSSKIAMSLSGKPPIKAQNKTKNAVNIHQFMDCVKTMKSGSIFIVPTNGMLCLLQEVPFGDETGTVFGAVSLAAGG